MFQETMRIFNHNLRCRLRDDRLWVLERKFLGIWWCVKDDRGNSTYSAVSDACIALYRITKK